MNKQTDTFIDKWEHAALSEAPLGCCRLSLERRGQADGTAFCFFSAVNVRRISGSKSCFRLLAASQSSTAVEAAHSCLPAPSLHPPRQLEQLAELRRVHAKTTEKAQTTKCGMI